jgi:hypothetical protein
MLQGAIGFAFVLFALPLLLLIGLPLSHAVILILVSMLVQVSIGAYQLRASIRWNSVFFATALRYATLPLGIFVLIQIDSLEASLAKQLIGVLVLLLLGVTIFGKVQPREKLHAAWGWLAFSTSGFLQGMSAIGGPPLILWVMAHRWSNAETRAFMFGCFMLSLPVQLFLLWTNYGETIWPILGTGVLLSPFTAIGSTIGVRLGHHIPKPLLRNIAYVALFITAMMSILGPLI